MTALEPVVLVAALALGAAFGAIAERSRFCLLSGVRDAAEARSFDKLAAFAAAALVAIAGTQTLAGLELLDLSKTAYLPAAGSLGGVAIGGVLFGLGAVAARGCLGRLTVLSATGNLRALVVVLVAGVVAYASMRGLFAAPRAALQGLGSSAAPAADLAKRLAEASGAGEPAARFALAGAAGAVALAVLVIFKARWAVLGGALIGALVVAGWATTGILGADDFEPAPLASLAFAQPLAQSVVYVMTATGARLDFGVMLVAGVLVGAAISSRLAGAAELQGFSEPRQMLRYLGGAALMGFGAVTAMGCTTGQGLTGLSTLAPLSFVALAAMIGGMRIGLAVERRAARREAQLVAAGAN